MNERTDLKFEYRDHHILVSHENVPDNWFGDYDTVFTVLIDGKKTVVPGIWKAYQEDGEKGVRLVLMAYLDMLPVTAH